jgi:hypothetical protein
MKSYGRLRRRWENNIKMDHRETCCEYVNRVKVTEDDDLW